MALVEIEQARGVQSSFPNAEVAEPTFLFSQYAAKTLATEYLMDRPHESSLHPKISREDAYMKGKMDVRAIVLAMVGQVHILALDPAATNINNPPILEVKPLNSSQLDALLKSYQEARFIDRSLVGKPITKISVDEAYAKGKMRELGKCLINLGQKNTLEAMDGTRGHIQNNDNIGGEVQ